MPVVMGDWKSAPLDVVAKTFADSKQMAVDAKSSASSAPAQAWEAVVAKFFADRLSSDAAVWDSVASLNVTPSHDLVDGQLVRFRCMIQDMFDPELYLSEFELRDLSSGRSRVESGRYRDAAPAGPRDEIVPDSPMSVTAERLSFYAISVPCEQPWASEAFSRRAPVVATASGSSSGRRLKRGLEDGVDKAEETAAAAATTEMEVEESVWSSSSAAVAASSSDAKRAKTTDADAPCCASSQPPPLINVPVPNPNAKAAILKLYDADADGEFKLNDVAEFAGVLSLDPSLAAAANDDADDRSLGASVLDGGVSMDGGDEFGREERLARDPPPSLVPRIHVVAHRRLVHTNPLLPWSLGDGGAMTSAEVESARGELHGLLTRLLLGDQLAANYLICHIISKVYLRLDVMSVGKFSLNLHGVPVVGGGRGGGGGEGEGEGEGGEGRSYSARLCELLRLMLANAHFMPLTVQHLNSSTLIPRKDYTANRLVSGTLQLPAGTHLLIDETTMADGQLSTVGLRNLAALGNVINWQKLDYDFNFHAISFETDLPVFVLSEGRSILPSDVQLLLQPCASSSSAAASVDAAFSSVGAELTAEVLKRLRRYLSVARHAHYKMTDDVQKAVQEDFVSERAAAGGGGGGGGVAGSGGGGRMPTQEDLHARLVLARLMAISHGQESLTPDLWSRCKSMDRERRRRAELLPPRPQRNGGAATARV